MGLLERYKGTSSPPSHRPVGCCGSQNTGHCNRPQDGRPSGTPSGLGLSVFVPLTAHCHPARQCKKTAHFFWCFCGVRNASLRRTFCCVVRGAPKTRLQGAPSSQHGSPRRLLSTRRQLSTLDSQPFHSRPRLALDSQNSRSGYRLCGQRGLEFGCGLRKGPFGGRNQTIHRL